MAHTPEIAAPRKSADASSAKSILSRLLASRSRRASAAGETFDERSSTRRRKTGSVLADLLKAAGPGWHTLDDISLGRGRIDHILIGPGGGFVVDIEVGGGIDSRQILLADEHLLDQVEADREALERVSGLEFEALLVMTNCWLVGSRLEHQSSVTVLPARLLPSHLRERPSKLAAEDAAEIAETLRLALAVDATPTTH